MENHIYLCLKTEHQNCEKQRNNYLKGENFSGPFFNICISFVLLARKSAHLPENHLPEDKICWHNLHRPHNRAISQGNAGQQAAYLMLLLFSGRESSVFWLSWRLLDKNSADRILNTLRKHRGSAKNLERAAYICFANEHYFQVR